MHLPLPQVNSVGGQVLLPKKMGSRFKKEDKGVEEKHNQWEKKNQMPAIERSVEQHGEISEDLFRCYL